MKKRVIGDTDLALGRWDVVPHGVDSIVVIPDRLVVAMADIHQLADAQTLTIAEHAKAELVSPPPHEGSVLPDRLRRLAQAHGSVPRLCGSPPTRRQPPH
jgi:hypothetical protein